MTRFVCAVAVGLALAAALAGCGPGGNYTGCHATGASPDRRSIFWTDGERGFARERDGRRASLAGSECARGAEQMFGFADGDRVLAFGTRSNIDFDLWGHAGRHVSAACVVDFAHGTVRPVGWEASTLDDARREPLAVRFEGERTFVWHQGDGEIEVLDRTGQVQRVLPVPDRATSCQAASHGAGLRVACVQSLGPPARLHIQELAAGGTPQGERVLPLSDIGIEPGSALSRDGRYLALWGNGFSDVLTIIDLDAGRVLWSQTLPHVRVVEFDPHGGAGLLAGQWTGTDTIRGLVHRFDQAGRDRAQWPLDSGPHALYWSAPGEIWADDGCRIDRHQLR
jgi:hypothetical protein